MVSFFCVLAPEGMNAIVFGRDKGGEVRRLLLTRKVYRQNRKVIYCNNIMMNLSYTVIACGIILSSVKLEKRFNIVETVSE